MRLHNIKHTKYWEVNWVFGFHVVHVVLKRCPPNNPWKGTMLFCRLIENTNSNVKTDNRYDGWPPIRKKSKAKNPRIDSVASTVIHTTGKKTNKQKNKKPNRKKDLIWRHGPPSNISELNLLTYLRQMLIKPKKKRMKKKRRKRKQIDRNLTCDIKCRK